MGTLLLLLLAGALAVAGIPQGSTRSPVSVRGVLRSLFTRFSLCGQASPFPDSGSEGRHRIGIGGVGVGISA